MKVAATCSIYREKGTTPICEGEGFCTPNPQGKRLTIWQKPGGIRNRSCSRYLGF